MVLHHTCPHLHVTYLNQNTDRNGSTTRVMLFDFRKAFDLIDHNILWEKLTRYNIPKTILDLRKAFDTVDYEILLNKTPARR